MQCLLVSLILNFPLLVLSLSREALNWIHLKRFSLCFSSDPLMDYRCIHSEYSSNGRCCHPITQAGLCHNCSCLLRGWHAIRSRKGQGRHTQEAISLQREQKNCDGKTEMKRPLTNHLSTNSRLICPRIESDAHISATRTRGKVAEENSVMGPEGKAGWE